MWVVLPLAVGLAAAAWWVRTRLVRVDVVGPSMYPTLGHGDVVLVRRSGRRSLRPGRIVVAAERDPTGADTAAPVTRMSGPLTDNRWIVKRIAAKTDGGQAAATAFAETATRVPPNTVFLLGDNPDASTDSRHLGPWPVDRLLGVVVCRLRSRTRLDREPGGRSRQ